MSKTANRNFGTMGTTPEQIDLLNVATSFCRDKSPIASVRTLLENELGYDPAVWQQIGDLGWLAIAIPEHYGGVGLGVGEIVPVMEQMGRTLFATPFLSTSMAAQAILKGGYEAQKQHLLPAIAAGQAVSMALGEHNNEWDLHAITASATRSKNGYILSGTKTLVLDLPSAAHVIVSVKRDGQSTLLVLPTADIAATAIRRERLIDETKRAYELKLDGIEVGEDAFFDPDKTADTLAHIHLVANLLGAAELCGGTQAVIDYTVEYLNTRKQFGKVIGSYQALKHPMVNAYIEYEKARSLLYAAANSFGEQGVGEIATRMAKAQADTALSFAADRSIQFHGGFGFTYDCDAQLYRRRAIFTASQYGDAAFHKAKLADLVLS